MLHEPDESACVFGGYAVDARTAALALPVVIMQHPGDSVQERRFSCAGGPQQQYFLPGFDAQVHVRERWFFAPGVVPTEVVKVDCGTAGGRIGGGTVGFGHGCTLGCGWFRMFRV